MVFYSFDKRTKSRDPIELKGRIREISHWKLIRLILTNVFQLFNIFLVQYKLFHRGIDNEVSYYATLVISLLSGVTILIFNARMNTINVDKHNRIMLISILIFLVVKYIYSCFAPPTIFYSGIIGHFFTEPITSLFVITQIPTFLRQTLVIICAIKSKYAKNEEDRTKFYHEMVAAEADAGFLGILECYLRGAPQLTLQIAVLFFRHANFTQISLLEQLSIAAALGVVLPWTATSYHSSLRKQRNDYFPFQSMVVFFIWNTFLLAARVLSISVVLAFWPVYTGMAVLVHWLMATLLLYCDLQPIDFYKKSKVWHFMFCSVFGMVYIFNIINMTKKRMFWHYMCFHVVVFVQNTVSLMLWCTNESAKTVIYRFTFVSITEVLFVCGILIMILYYIKLHPRSKRNRLRKNDHFSEQTELQIFKINFCNSEKRIESSIE